MEPSWQGACFVTFGRMDAAVEPTGMYSQRVTKQAPCHEGEPDD